MTKIAISSKGKTIDSEVDPRFGRCSYFLIVDVNTMDFELLGNEGAAAFGGAGVSAAQSVIRSGAKVVLTGNVGPNAFRTLKAGNIKVITGIGGTVSDAVKDFKTSDLKETESPTVGGHFGQKEDYKKNESGSEKVCIPTLGDGGMESMVGEHFGRVPTYTIVDLDKDDVKVIPNTSHHGGGKGYPPELMKEEGVDVMICKNIGRRAISMFNDFGIELCTGAGGTVRQIIEDYRKGKLKKAGEDDACEQHAFRKHKE